LKFTIFPGDNKRQNVQISCNWSNANTTSVLQLTKLVWKMQEKTSEAGDMSHTHTGMCNVIWANDKVSAL